MDLRDPDTGDLAHDVVNPANDRSALVRKTSEKGAGRAAFIICSTRCQDVFLEIIEREFVSGTLRRLL